MPKGHSLKFFSFCLFLLVFSFFLSHNTHATNSFINSPATLSTNLGKIPDGKEDLFYNNNIMFYEWCPNGDESNGGTCSPPTGDQITWIGDSYSCGAKSEILSTFPGVDIGENYDQCSNQTSNSGTYIQGSKFFKGGGYDTLDGNPSGLTLLKHIIEEKKLRKYLVFALGTNGYGTNSNTFAQYIDELVELAGNDTQIILTTVYVTSGTVTINDAIKAAANKYSNISVADWAATAQASYYAQDSSGIHPFGNYDKWVKVIQEALPQSCDNTGLLEGKDNAEKIWNFFVKANISGVSDNAAVISGILGNLFQESRLDPLIPSGLYGDIHGELSAELASTGSQDQNDKAIEVELTYLTQKNSNFKLFTDNLSIVSNTSGVEGAASYADLFMATVERNINAGNGTSKLSDSKVADWVDSKMYPPGSSNHGLGHDLYQQAKEREDFARDYYNKYTNAGSSNTTSSNLGSGTSSNSNNNSSSTGNNKDYTGNQILSDDQMNQLEINQQFYQKAAEKYNVDWQIIAAIHYREHKLSRSNPNGDGPYQMPGIMQYCINNHGTSFSANTETDDSEFQKHTDCVAHYAADYDITDSDSIKRFFYAYNSGGGATSDKTHSYYQQAIKLGFSEQEALNGEGSPYVMNKADEKRDPNKNPTGWGQIKANGGGIEYPANQDYGAFVVYQALGGSTSSSTSSTIDECGGGGDGDGNCGDRIAQTAIKLAWPDASQNGTPKSEYSEALSSVSSSYCQGANGKDCGCFVGTVVRSSGIDDPDYPQSGTPLLQEHMEKSDLWEEISNEHNSSNLQPGDVFVYNGSGGGWGANGHTFIYIGDDKIAQAHLGSATGYISSIYYQEPGGSYHIFRYKGSGCGGSGTKGAFDEDLTSLEGSTGYKIGAYVTAPGDSTGEKVQYGGSWPGGRAWSTIKVPMSIAAVQGNTSTGSVTDPYGGTCSYGSAADATRATIKDSSNCPAWWLWVSLGGDNSGAADAVNKVLRAGHDENTSVNSNGDGSSLTSGKTNWALYDQVIFAANMTTIDGSSVTTTQMKEHGGSGDNGSGLMQFSNYMVKGGWGGDITRQFGIVKLSNGQCVAAAIGLSGSGNDFSTLSQIATVLKNHESDLPSGACPAGL